MSDNIEDIFKQRFDDFEMEPRASLFNDILSKKKKKRRKAIWIAAATIGVLTIGTSLYIHQQSSSSLAELNPEKQEKIEEQVANSTNDNIEQQLNKSAKDESLLNCYSPAGIDITEEYIPNALQTPNSLNQGNHKITQKDGKTSQLTADIQKELAKEYQEILDVDRNIKTNKAKVFVKDEVYEADIIKPEHLEEAKKRFELEKQDNSGANEANSKNEELSEISSVSVEKQETRDNKEQNVEHSIPAISKWGIDVNAGAGLSIPLFGNAEMNQRATTESRGFAHQFELSTWYRLNSKVRFSIGLAYSTYNYSLNFTQPDVLDITSQEVEIKETIIHPVLGEIERLRKETIQDTTIIKGDIFSETNRYQFVTLPIGAEYNFYLGNRWTISPRLRGLILLNTAVNGYYVADNTLHQLPEESYHKRGLQQADLGIGVAYRFSKNLEASWSPNTQFSISKLDMNTPEIRHLGLFNSVGLRYNF
jgi:hypothetical protein